MANKGSQYEQYLAIRFGFKLNPNPNCKATEGADLYKDGIGYQVKSDNATLANNHGIHLGDNIVAEFAELIKQDKSDKVILIGTWSRTTNIFTFDKQQIQAMIHDTPEILYYSYDSRTKDTTIRVRVKKKFDYYYQRNADKVQRV